MRDIAISDFIGIAHPINKEKGDTAFMIQVYTANIIVIKPGLEAFHKVFKTAGFHRFPPVREFGYNRIMPLAGIKVTGFLS